MEQFCIKRCSKNMAPVKFIAVILLRLKKLLIKINQKILKLKNRMLAKSKFINLIKIIIVLLLIDCPNIFVYAYSNGQIKIQNPYDFSKSKRILTQMHSHTNLSDGQDSPEQLIEKYYNFPFSHHTSVCLIGQHSFRAQALILP